MTKTTLLAALLLALIFTPTRADQVILSTGEVLKGTITSQDDDKIVLEHPVLGTISVPRAGVASTIVPAPVSAAKPVLTPGPAAASPDAKSAIAKAQSDIKALPDARNRFVDNWDAKLELGLAGSQGNSDTFDGHIGFRATKEDAKDRWNFDTAYFKGISSGQTTRNDFTAGVLKDWLFRDSKWFWWADGRYDYDDFKSWQQRVSAHTGPGYTFYDTEKFRLIGRIGAGGRKEWGSDNEGLVPEGLASGEFKWKLTDNQSLLGSATYYPDLGDLGEYRLRDTLDWVCAIDKADGLSLKIGLLHEYESEVDPGRNHNDLKYFAALLFDF